MIVSLQDYYAFGMEMPDRSYNAGSYRYGYNGKENDKETGWQDYGFRLYDKRICRFPSVDPLTAKYPFYTPYQFAGNMPILFIDLDGLEPASPKEDLVETSSSNYPYQNGTISNVIDPAKNDTEMSLFMPANSDKSYSWKTWDDKDAVFSEASQQNGEWNGRWVQYEPVPSYERQSQLAAYDFCDKAALGTATVFGGAAMAPIMGVGFGVVEGASSFGLISTGSVLSTDLATTSILLRGSIDAAAQTISNIAYGKSILNWDVGDTGLAAFTAPGFSAYIGGAVDFQPFRLFDSHKNIPHQPILSVMGINKGFEKSVLEMGVKYTFGSGGPAGGGLTVGAIKPLEGAFGPTIMPAIILGGGGNLVGKVVNKQVTGKLK